MIWGWLVCILTRPKPPEESWDSSYPAPPDDMDCPDTQPTTPGALDTDPGRIQ